MIMKIEFSRHRNNFDIRVLFNPLKRFHSTNELILIMLQMGKLKVNPWLGQWLDQQLERAMVKLLVRLTQDSETGM